jgi:phage terminase large subunit-like protein
VSGTELVPTWNFACPDWEDRIRTGRSLIPDLPLFEDEASLALEFFNRLRLPDVPGLPLLRDACGQWFKEIVAALFGSRDPLTNVRHVSEIFALVAKKNSKTSYAAGLMIVAMLMNIRPRAEFLFVGPTQAIADLAYNQAVGMIDADDELKKRFRVRDHIKEIVDLLNRSRLKIKTFDLEILTGPKPVGIMLDELHLLGKNAAASKVIRQLRGGLQANPEGFMVITTTQSDDAPAGAFKDELTVARAIRDGRAVGKMLPILYEFPPDIAQSKEKIWQDQKYWPMVLPNLGRSLDLDRLVADWNVEKLKGEHAVRVFASQHLNLEIGLSLSSDRWVGADHWEAAIDATLTLDEVIERSEVVVVGLDGGGLDDLLGMAVLGREKKTRRWLLWSHAWAHNGILELRKSIASKLEDLQKAKELTIYENTGEDVRDVVDIIQRLVEAGLLPEKKAIGVDPVGITDIVDELSAREMIHNDEWIVGVPQGWRLNNSILTAERRLAGKELLHPGSAIMAWCVGNAKVQQRGNAKTIEKQAAGTAKIDPLIALFDAIALMVMNPEASRSVYEDAEVVI